MLWLLGRNRKSDASVLPSKVESYAIGLIFVQQLITDVQFAS